MGFRYRTGDRVFGGSMEPRLNPDLVSSHINADIGAKHLPFPMVRNTEGNRAIPEQDKRRRHSQFTMLPDRFFRK